ATITGLKRLPILSIDGSKGDMHQFCTLIKTCLPCDFENRMQMLLLPLVDDIEDFSGTDGLRPVHQSCQISRAVKSCTIGFLDNKRWKSVSNINNQCAIALTQKTLGF